MKEKKRKPGRPRLKVHRVRRSGCTVTPATAHALDRWEELLREVDPAINPGRLLDRLVDHAEKLFDRSTRLTVELCRMAKAAGDELSEG